jgi:hypothetical protein
MIDSAPTAIVGELTRRGVSRSAAENLATSFPKKLIAEKVALHDRLLERRDKRMSKNPPGFLAAAIRNDYRSVVDVSRGAGEQTRANTVYGNKNSQPAAESQKSDQKRHEAALRYWQSLSESEREELEARAIATSERIRVNSYERLKESGSRLREVLREDIVANYLQREGFLPNTVSDPASIGRILGAEPVAGIE